ncbi:MAG: hypothetical protein PHO10_09685 [Gemmiger sp.]|nr:hypothetical protein [Gemmiger sp.]
MNAKALRKQLIAAVAMLLVAAIALGSSTFAWFISNTTVKAASATVSAVTSNTLLIADITTGEEKPQWSTSLAWTDSNKTFVPVSTIASSTAATMEFYTSEIWATDTSGAYTASTFTKIEGTAPTQYFSKTFQIKASQACQLYLDTETEFKKTAGVLPSTLRLALVVTDSKDAYKGTYLYQVDDAATTLTTVNTTLESLAANGIIKGINGASTASEILGTNVTGAGVPKLALATKPDSTALASTLNGADSLYQFATADEICKITAYIWMEGCDYDCNAAVVSQLADTANQVVASLGFAAGAAA